MIMIIIIVHIATIIAIVRVIVILEPFFGVLAGRLCVSCFLSS